MVVVVVVAAAAAAVVVVCVWEGGGGGGCQGDHPKSNACPQVADSRTPPPLPSLDM